MTTARIIFGISDPTKEQRNLAKAIFYVTAYGGSVMTCHKKTGIPLNDLEKYIAVANSRFVSIAKLREEVHRSNCGNSPADGDHPGKSLGLFAQGKAADVFKKMLVKIDRLLFPEYHDLAKIIFTVHDEIVFDCHNSFIDKLHELKLEAERHVSSNYMIPFTMKMFTGKNYGQMFQFVS